jgi:hypothetical protein
MNSPVKDAYTIALEKDKNEIGRNSWDQTAVLVAVRGFNPYFTYRRLNLKIEDNGSDTLIAGTKLFYIEFKADPHKVQDEIEKLMHHQPVKKPD